MKKTKIILCCSICFANNYSKNKSSQNPSRVELKKFCPRCKTHTAHKEEK
ncbi:50S ribosomal protein L33 [Mycoplasmopsis californica]|uniref:Large ribosomal subunit protein bL33 n=1 Tax=Mycoplasmopsis californica TaxID=2113 RepID=A0A059XV43_9BACT|nr:50S ribosomal protein L33 [Mycoplasmopsis californica]AIA29196.1 50S ribosomal protein L33 [Mycoplasmopsis californica]